jgi:streptogrisin C
MTPTKHASLLALAIAAIVVPAHAAAIEPEVGPEMLRALQRDVGISRQQLPAYMALEQQAEAQDILAKRHFGDRYAGSWIERDSTGAFRHVVASTDTRKLRSLNGATVRPATHSLRELDASMNALNGTIAALKAAPGIARAKSTQPDGLHAWYVDVRNNRVVVRVADGAMDEAIDFIAASGADINAIDIETSQGRPMPAVNIYGGRQYGTGGGSCSIGFAVTRGSTKGFATAGHCGRAGTSVSVGGTTVGSVQRSSFPGDDMAWASVRSVDTLIGLVDRYNGSGSDVRVVGSTQAGVGTTVCRSGFASGYRCGTITSTNVTVNYSAGATFQLSQSNACLTQGDSGGSWITTTGQAQGVSSGGQLGGASPPFSNCQFSSPVSYFQKINEILSTYGLTLTRG